jgi:hypothetical protein
MTFTRDEALDPFAPPFELGRDLPLSFHSRTEPSVIAALGLSPARSPRHEDARNAVLTEAKLAHERNSWVSFSRWPAFYVGRCRYQGDTFRYRLILTAVADGVRAGLLEEDRALPGSRGFQSRFRATPLLCERLNEQPIRAVAHEVIWLRDDQRRLVTYNDTAITRRMRKEVEAINAAMTDIAIDLPKAKKRGRHWVVSDSCVLPTAPSVRRVFNRGSFEKGGRLYGWFQNMPAADRARLLLNGAPVLEPDYAQIHAQIIYALRGISLIGDAYETAEFPREFGKRAFNIAVNARSLRTAVAALAHELGMDRRTAAKVISSVTAKHDRVADVFCSDIGVDLMRIDSDITLEAVRSCQAQSIPVLPVHDSLIVPAPDADKAAEIMVMAFAARFPQTKNCEVRIKKNQFHRLETLIPHSGRNGGVVKDGSEGRLAA